MRRGLVGLLAPALLVTACGSQVKQAAPTPTPTASLGIPWPVVTATATPGAITPSPSTAPTSALSPSATPSATPTATPTATPSDQPMGRNPLLLVGWWRVATAAGEADLGLGDRGVVVHACGTSSLQWSASPTGLFVGARAGEEVACHQQSPPPDVRWFERGWAFAVSKQRLLLVDDAGAVVARGVREQPPPGQQPFAVTPALRARLADAKQLPPGVRPATARQLQRRWVPKGAYAGNGKAFVAFGKDRAWTGSDGCNGAGGRFSLGDFGELLATAGPTTLIGCDSSPAPQWVTRARRLALVNGTLSLYDGRAALIGRLYPG